MLIIVRSRKEIETIPPPQKRHTIISIRSSIRDQTKAAVLHNEHTEAILHLKFDDLDRIPSGAAAIIWPECILFNSYHAEAVHSVIRATSPEVVICQCAAGISRSAGMAAALSKFYNKTDTQFFGGRYRPNMLVYRKMLQQLEETNESIHGR